MAKREFTSAILFLFGLRIIHSVGGEQLAIIEWVWVGYEEFCRSRRDPPRSAEFFISYESRIQ